MVRPTVMKMIERIVCAILEWMFAFEGKNAAYFFSIAHGETHPQHGTADEAFADIRDAAARNAYSLIEQRQYGAPRDRVVFRYRTHMGDEFLIQYCLDSGFAYSSKTIPYDSLVTSASHDRSLQ